MVGASSGCDAINPAVAGCTGGPASAAGTAGVWACAMLGFAFEIDQSLPNIYQAQALLRSSV